MGEAWGCHGPKSSTMAFEGKDGGWFFVYEQTEKATREHHRYTQKDKDEYAKRLGGLLITSSVTLKDVYRIATEDLREDLLKVFSHGRVRIVGAALCKHTPNMGNGYNGGIQDLVAAVPGLCRMLKVYPTDKAVETESIRDVLTEYQKQREEDLKAYWQISYSGTQMQAGYNYLYWMFERWIIPVFDLNRPLFILSLGRLISGGKVLPFLPEKHPLYGKVPWKHYADDAMEPARKNEYSWMSRVNWRPVGYPCPHNHIALVGRFAGAVRIRSASWSGQACHGIVPSGKGELHGSLKRSFPIL